MSLLHVDALRLQHDDRLIQEQVSFEVSPGTIFGVLGGSGCGKSTLLRSLMGLHAPSAGRVLIDGQDYWAASAPQRQALRATMGCCFKARPCGHR